jgi:hypothetical protein
VTTVGEVENVKTADRIGFLDVESKCCGVEVFVTPAEIATLRALVIYQVNDCFGGEILKESDFCSKTGAAEFVFFGIETITGLVRAINVIELILKATFEGNGLEVRIGFIRVDLTNVIDTAALVTTVGLA